MSTEPRVASRPSPLQVLLGDAIDYAGLFPPAQLDMSGAVAEYASYLRSSDNWALGRFVVPVARLDELATEAEAAVATELRSLGGGAGVWRLSALFGNDVPADLERTHVFNDAQASSGGTWVGQVEAIELRASTPEAIASAASLVGKAFECFVEVPIATDPTTLIRAIGTAELRAKVRTGGTSSDAFPSSQQLARFIAACVAAHVPFKATAGLHHPIRGDYALTYAADSPRGTMFGFLNVFLAAAFVGAGASESTIVELLDERRPDAVRFDEDGVTWHGHRLTRDELAASRRVAITSFGSCSFREPLEDLASLGLL